MTDNKYRIVYYNAQNRICYDTLHDWDAVAEYAKKLDEKQVSYIVQEKQGKCWIEIYSSEA